MNLLLYRLPPQVKCLSDGTCTILEGPRGQVFLNFRANFVQNSQILLFSKSLNTRERILFKQALYGVSLSYTIVLTLQGIGYRVDKIGNNLSFKLGYSHPLDIVIPDVIKVNCAKNTISLRSSYLPILKSFSFKLRKLRFPDSYKGNGVLYRGEIIKKKEGKKS